MPAPLPWRGLLPEHPVRRSDPGPLPPWDARPARLSGHHIYTVVGTIDPPAGSRDVELTARFRPRDNTMLPPVAIRPPQEQRLPLREVVTEATTDPKVPGNGIGQFTKSCG